MNLALAEGWTEMKAITMKHSYSSGNSSQTENKSYENKKQNRKRTQEQVASAMKYTEWSILEQHIPRTHRV